ncbi:MAG TPA: ketosteroid isomerase [Blastocatellia bacterium]|nr:ketosteroid isomerase [Blastocatellia bacterium]
MSPEVVSKAVKAYFEAIRAMDQRAWVNTFAEDAVTYDPVGAPPTKGHQKLGEFFQTITAAFKEVGLTEDQVFIAGNGAAVKWTGRGVSKQGRTVHFEGIDVFAVNEAGRIQSLHAYWNPAEMVAQL